MMWANGAFWASNNTDDINIVVDGLLLEGVCVWENKEKLKSELSRLLDHPDLQDFFDKKWEVKNEKEILTKEGIEMGG